MASSHCASPTRSIGAGCATPALLTRMSISPSSVRTLASSAAISNRCETSARIDTARRPCSAMSVHVSTASASRSRNVIATSAPASASARATARPMPRLPPVTRARRPASGRTGAGFFSAMGQRLLRDPRRMRVDVEAAAADEADQRDAGFLGQLDRQARRRRHRGDERHAGQPRLLQDLERGAAADEQQRVAGRQPAGQQPPADDLVDGVVPPDVLGGVDDVAVERAQRGGVQAAGGGERLLERREARRQRADRVGIDGARQNDGRRGQTRRRRDRDVRTCRRRTSSSPAAGHRAARPPPPLDPRSGSRPRRRPTDPRAPRRCRRPRSRSLR